MDRKDTSGLTVFFGDEIVNPDDIMKWELAAAKRALKVLKEAVGTDKMTELLKPHFEESTARWKKWAEDSNGEFHTGTTVMLVEGVLAADYNKYMMSNLMKGNQPFQYAAHPEHFGFKILEDKNCMVNETFGHHYGPVNLLLKFGPITEPKTEGAVGILCDIMLPDSTFFGTILNEYVDTDKGMKVILTVKVPKATDPSTVHGHEEHLAVEFSNWVRMFKEARTAGEI
jgi:hypothetical protein